MAMKHHVISCVNPEDFIFRYLIDNKAFDNIEDAVAYYFDDGACSAEKLRNLLLDVCGWHGEAIDILEFASGYGCVTRHFENVLPEVALTSCDIHYKAVQFIAMELNVHAVLSSSVPENLNPVDTTWHWNMPDKYDVVFALSFFSHMPKTTWTRWFNALLSRVKMGGFLIFTTHGLLSGKFLGSPEVDQDGFWFLQSSEQKDLDTLEYGLTLTNPLFVFEEAAKNPKGHIICFRQGYWWNHQDLYIVERV